MPQSVHHEAHERLHKHGPHDGTAFRERPAEFEGRCGTVIATLYNAKTRVGIFAIA